jgi:hypothetical protein
MLRFMFPLTCMLTLGLVAADRTPPGRTLRRRLPL